MPRMPRLIPDAGYMHIMCRGNNRRRLFFYQRDYRVYYRLLCKLKSEYPLKILHYCIMPNHAHLFTMVTKDSELGKFMMRLNLCYSNYFCKRRNYVGQLWQGRFKSKIITDDGYYLQCGKYIELNPVRAGLVEKPEEYPYSSYNYYAFGSHDQLIDEDPFYSNMTKAKGDKQKAYRRIIVGENVSEMVKIDARVL